MGKPAVISISSHVVRGSVGNRASVFALETLGFPVWAIPTITLPWHPGHGTATKLVPNAGEFDAFIQDIANAPWIGEVGAVLTGYMATSEQVDAVTELIASLKAANPNLIYLCDPVIGDKAGLYVDKQIASAIREKLIPLCDIATPNRYELAWLLENKAPTSLSETLRLAKQLGPPKVLVTSCPAEKSTQIGNLFVDNNQTLLATHEALDHPPNGPGDLTAAVFLANLLSGIEARYNLGQTTSAVFEIMQHSVEQGSDELELVSKADSLLDPKADAEIVEL